MSEMKQFQHEKTADFKFERVDLMLSSMMY